MREPAAIFHATKEKSRAVGQQRSARIKNAVHGIRPIFCGKDRIVWMPVKWRLVFIHGRTVETFFSKNAHRELLSVTSASSSLRISSSAIKKDSVDSAPWFSLARSGCKPSRHPPVV